MALPLIGFFTGGLFAKVLALVLASAAVRIFAAVGFAVVTYVGVDLLFGQIETAINLKISGLSADMFAMLNIFGLVFFMQSVLAAFTAIVAIKGLQSIKRGIFK